MSQLDMMLKKISLSVIYLCLFFSSCKKQYSCQCATTYQKTGYNSFTVSSVEKINSKTTKKTAQQTCAHAEKQMAKNQADYISGNEKVTVSCALK